MTVRQTYRIAGWGTASQRVTVGVAGVGVDFFLAAPSGGYLDIATIGKYSLRIHYKIPFYHHCS